MTRVPSYSASECGCLVLWLRMAGHFTTVGFRVAAVFCVSAFLYPSVATGQRASRTALWHLARETGGATAPGRCKHVRTSQSGRGERFCRAWPAQRLQLLPDPQRRSCARARVQIHVHFDVHLSFHVARRYVATTPAPLEPPKARALRTPG